MLVLSHFQQKKAINQSFSINPTTRLKFSTTRRLRNADLDHWLLITGRFSAPMRYTWVREVKHQTTHLFFIRIIWSVIQFQGPIKTSFDFKGPPTRRAKKLPAIVKHEFLFNVKVRWWGLTVSLILERMLNIFDVLENENSRQSYVKT